MVTRISWRSKLTSILPPLHVAKFRWWRCQNCLQEIGATSAAEKIGIIPYCEKSGLISNSTCSHMNKHGESSMVLSDVDQASKLDTFEGETVNANTCSSKKEKYFEVGCHSAIIGILFDILYVIFQYSIE